MPALSGADALKKLKAEGAARLYYLYGIVFEDNGWVWFRAAGYGRSGELCKKSALKTLPKGRPHDEFTPI